jgi:hypothetical protein
LESGFSFKSDQVDIAVPDANNPYNEASGHRHVGPPPSIYLRVLLASRSAWQSGNAVDGTCPRSRQWWFRNIEPSRLLTYMAIPPVSNSPSRLQMMPE